MDEDESPRCGYCEGSGEGMTDGSRCLPCKGTGREQATKDEG